MVVALSKLMIVKHWVCLLLMVNVLNNVMSKVAQYAITNDKVSKDSMPIIVEFTQASLQHYMAEEIKYVNIPHFCKQAFGSCEIYIFMWSFSLLIVCYKQGGKIMYVCLERFQFVEIKIGKPMKCFSSKVVMFKKCLAYNYDVL